MSESVDNREKVGVTSRLRKGIHNVNMGAVESAFWYYELVQRRNGVAMNLGAPTGSAGSYPSSNILVDAMPHKALCDELLHGQLLGEPSCGQCRKPGGIGNS